MKEAAVKAERAYKRYKRKCVITSIFWFTPLRQLLVLLLTHIQLVELNFLSGKSREEHKTKRALCYHYIINSPLQWCTSANDSVSLQYVICHYPLKQFCWKTESIIV